MKQKGFTLTEILAVLVLISVLAILVVPSIINYVNESKEEISKVTSELIYSGAKLYVESKPNEYPKELGNEFCVSLHEVVDANYLSAPILDSVSGNEIDLNKFVHIKSGYDNELQMNKFEFEITESCKMCILLSDSDNSGTISYGDKYSCNPGDGYRNFYVLETGTMVTLITDRNLDNDTMDGESAELVLESKTNNWINSIIKTIDFPSQEQAWLLYNLKSKVEYCDSDPISEIPNGFWLSHEGYNALTPRFYMDCDGIENIRSSESIYFGIRPVITVSEIDL